MDELDQLLSRAKAAMPSWQVRALFLGASASTNTRLGPHHLLDRIFTDGLPGNSIQEANAAIQVLGMVWNGIQDDRMAGHVRLSAMALSSPPTHDELRAMAQRRHDEVLWFIRGIDAGGDDPIEFGPDGQDLLTKLGEASGFCEAYTRMLDKDSTADEQARIGAAQALGQLTATIENLMLDLTEITTRVRMEAIDALHERAASGAPTDDGAPPLRVQRVGRNEICPCGSGKKFKKCCGAPDRVQ